jgi:hypothetical protein
MQIARVATPFNAQITTVRMSRRSTWGRTARAANNRLLTRIAA